MAFMDGVQEYEIVKEVMENITLEEVNKKAKE